MLHEQHSLCKNLGAQGLVSVSATGVEISGSGSEKKDV